MKIKDMKIDRLYKCTDKYNDNLILVNNRNATLLIDNKIVMAFPLTMEAIINSEWEEIENLPDKYHEKLQEIKLYCESIKESTWKSHPEIQSMMSGILNIINEENN